MDINDARVPINLDIERNLIFPVRVMKKCIEKYGKMDNVLSAFDDLSGTMWLATEMLNADAEIRNKQNPDSKIPLITEEELELLVFGVHGINELQSKVQEAMLKGLPEDKVREVEEMAEEIEKNWIAAQREKIFGKKKNRK